ncbi:MAG: hypothetical protein KDD05_10060 [Psychroserpens sp.]|jgi:hypothetical protein|nr:hypothetical protein [Psychroserpens sp.]
MKKNILLIAAALFLFLGNQSVNAQAKMKKEAHTEIAQKSEVSAKEKMMNLVRPLGLNDKQQEQVLGLFAKAEEKMSKAKKESDTQEIEAKQTKMDAFVTSKMKEILDEEQYKKYLDLAKAL